MPAIRSSNRTVELTTVARGVSEGNPDNLGVFVAQYAFSNFPDDVINRASLIEDDDNTLALIVQAGESFSLLHRPCNEVGSPLCLMLRIFDPDRGGVDIPPVDIQTQAKPLLNF